MLTQTHDTNYHRVAMMNRHISRKSKIDVERNKYQPFSFQIPSHFGGGARGCFRYSPLTLSVSAVLNVYDSVKLVLAIMCQIIRRKQVHPVGMHYIHS